MANILTKNRSKIRNKNKQFSTAKNENTNIISSQTRISRKPQHIISSCKNLLIHCQKIEKTIKRYNKQKRIKQEVHEQTFLQYETFIFSKNYFLQWRMPLRQVVAKVI